MPDLILNGLASPPWYAPLINVFRSDLLDYRVLRDPARKNRVYGPLSTRIKIYIAITLIAMVCTFKTAMRVAGPGCINYLYIEPMLHDGWLFGLKIDDSDYQYEYFRDQLFRMTIFHLLHIAFRRIYSLVDKNRVRFDFAFGLLFVWLAYGTELIKIFVLWGLNYLIPVLVLDRLQAIAATWAYNLFMLYAQRKLVNLDFGLALLDNGYKGLFAGWDASFNFSILRMISHNIDYIVKRDSMAAGRPGSERGFRDSPKSLDEWKDLDFPRRAHELVVPRKEYSVMSYIAYMLYFPLFFNGPTITFNDYVSQSRNHKTAFVACFKNRIVYAFRWLACFLVTEVLMHYTYPSAYTSANVWMHLSPYELSVLVLYTAKYFWLKMLINWRYLRMWALLDGIDPPENMFRCVYNSYRFSSFWRQWHRSFNQWILQYIFVPLGGSQRHAIFNSIVAFTFVALWHNISVAYLFWGWVVAAAVLIESLVIRQFSPYSDCRWFHYAKGLGAVFNVWVMVLSNLYGFILGNQGTAKVLQRLFFSRSGMLNFCLTLVNIYICVMLMMEVRRAEVYRGVHANF